MADWGERTVGLLHDLEPNWFPDQPLAVRIAVYYLVFTVLLFSAHGMVMRLLTALGRLVAAGGRLAGQLVVFHTPEVAELFADLVMVGRSWQRRDSGPDMHRFAERVTVQLDEKFERKRTNRATPLLFLLATLSVLVVVASWFAAMALLPLLFGLVIVLGTLRLHIYTLLGLVAALWYAGVLHGVASKTAETINNKTSTALLLAAGTILAALYAAMNVDVRGRAELNKTASVNCRLLLLKCTPALIEAATALAVLRLAAAEGLRAFPTSAELRDLTGRDDVTLGEASRFLPSAASFFATELRFSPSPHSLVRTDEVAEILHRLRNARDRIDAELVNIFDAGLVGKMERVLGFHAQTALATAANTHFGLTNAEAVVVPEDKDTFEFLFGDNADWYLPLFAEMARFGTVDHRLRNRSAVLARLVDTAVWDQRALLWQMLLTETRLRLIAAKIDSSLRPGPFERIRQFYGK